MKLPVIGNLFHLISLERFCRVLSSLSSAGVPLPVAIGLSADSTNNSLFTTQMVAVRDALVRGGGLYEPMAETGLFPIAARQMIQVGERTGLFGNQLGKAASYYEREVDVQDEEGDRAVPAGRHHGRRSRRRFHRCGPGRGDVQHLWPGQVRYTSCHLQRGNTRVAITRHQQIRGNMKMNNSSIIQDQIDGEQDDKGFTLIEILIAIVLVGILSAVAVVGISSLVSKGSSSACNASLDAAKAGSAVYFAENGHLSADARRRGERRVPDAAHGHHGEPSRGDTQRPPTQRQRPTCRPRVQRQLEADDDHGRNHDGRSGLRLHLS